MNSQRTILAVIIFLGLVALATVVGGFALAYNDIAIPAELIGLGSVAVGAVGGILAKTGTEPIPVAVEASPSAAEAVAAAVPAPADFGPLRDKLGAAAQQLLDVAHALGDEAAAAAPPEPGV